MGALAQLITSLAVGVLRWLAERQDIKNTARAELFIHASQLAQDALQWKADSVARPDRGARLRVRDGGDKIIDVRSDHPNPPEPAP